MPDDEIVDKARATADALEAKAASVADDLKGIAIDAAAALQSTMRNLAEQMIVLAREMKALSAYGRRNRRLIRLLVVSVCFDVLLSVGLGALFVRSNTTAERTRAACVAGNETRANQITLWSHVLDISRRPDPTPEQAKSAADFEQFINDTFAARDCH